MLRGVDWSLLIAFVLMFVDLGLLERLPAVARTAERLVGVPGGGITAGALLSQVLSNVPAAIFLRPFVDGMWRDLAWGVSVGGFGLAVGSLANLIALRLARQSGLSREFHRWSILMYAGGFALSILLSRSGS